MTSKYGPLGMRVADRYRNVPEALIIEMLLLVGWANEAGSPAAAEATREALHAWIRNGLRFRQAPGGERLYDPVEVHNFMKRAGVEGRDGFWSERFVPTHRRYVTDLEDSNPPEARKSGKRRFTVDFKRTFNLAAIAQGSKLRLRMPLPQTGNYLTELQVKPLVENAPEAQITVNPGRLEARMVASGQPEVVLGAKLSFTARLQEPGPGHEGECPDRAPYLNHREGLVVVSDRIRALTQSLARADSPSLEAAHAFFKYIMDNLICGSVHYDQIDLTSPCDWILDSGWYDCQIGATLFVALCRAHGIPARICSGYFLYELSPSTHYWTEVWIDNQGWTPFDTLVWDLSMGGRDVKWHDRFFGRLDYRLTCQRLPLEFTGALGVQIPPAWFVLQVPKRGGVEIRLQDINGTLVYVDTVHVTG